MNETSKAMRRRACEDIANGDDYWSTIFRGAGIDIGPGRDPLRITREGVTVQLFDQAQGDANRLSTYFPPGCFDFIHASQALEHMHDPEALDDWLTLLRPGGHAVITVPDWHLYEQMHWPSRWNPDHKSTWSMSAKGSPARNHVHVPKWGLKRGMIRARLIDNNYNYAITNLDQTADEAAGVEAFIEMVFKR